MSGSMSGEHVLRSFIKNPEISSAAHGTQGCASPDLPFSFKWVSPPNCKKKKAVWPHETGEVTRSYYYL